MATTGDDGMPAGVGQHAVVSAFGTAVQAGRDATVVVRPSARRVAWPVRVGVPPVPAGHYQERQAHVLLEEALAAGRAAVVVGAPQRPGVVVSGLGGVGKSQLAARHAWRVWSDAGVDLAVWVSAVSRDAVVTAYAEAAARVLAEQDPRIAERPPERAAALFREWLAATSRRWLVVLDDVRDPAEMRSLDPPPGAGGQVIVTSRLRDAALTRDGRRLIELDVFTEDEAVTYLTGVLGDHVGAESEELHGLAADLGWLPLALGQAAAFIADQPLLTVAAYRAMLADRGRPLAELTPREEALPEHQVAVAATWSMSVERADRAGVADRGAGVGLARPLLEITSLLDPNGTPLEVLTARPVLAYLEHRAGRAVLPGHVTDGLTRLHRFSLITLDPARPALAVAVHSLLQRAVRDTLVRNQLARLLRTVADALVDAWPDIDTVHPELARSLRSATTTLTSYASAGSSAFLAVLKRAGRSLGDAGQVDAEVAHWRMLCDQVTTHIGADSHHALSCRHKLGHALGKAGDPARAVAELQRVLADQRRTLGPEDPDTLATFHDLARWWGKAGNPARAVAEYEKLLTKRLRVLGHDHPGTFDTRTSLAAWRAVTGDAAYAVAEMERLLADCLRSMGPEHRHTLDTRHNLARSRGVAGDPAAAVAEFEELLADLIRVVGPDNPRTLAARGNLAHWRGEAGDPARAVTECEELLMDCLRVLGPDHTVTLVARLNLARRRSAAGDPDRAIAEYGELLADCHEIPDYFGNHYAVVNDSYTGW